MLVRRGGERKGEINKIRNTGEGEKIWHWNII